MLICQLTDLHVCAPGVLANQVSPTNMLTERACRVVGAFTPRPDVVMLTGDLTENGLVAEYANLAAIIGSTLLTPVYVIPGNHDQRDNLRAGLAHLPGVASDAEFVQYAIEDYPVRMVMLDTLVPGEAHGEQSPEQLQWLDRTLAAEPSKPTLVGMHHPPFPTGVAHMDRIGLHNAEAFRSVIARHRQVQRIVCGHQHRPVIAQCAQAVVSIAPSVAHQVALTLNPNDAGAFNFEPPGVHLHTWDNTNGFVTHTLYTDNYPGPFAFGAGSAPDGM
jgi:3',5'-cyclic AMP phosphodiesterase CpdA